MTPIIRSGTADVKPRPPAGKTIADGDHCAMIERMTRRILCGGRPVTAIVLAGGRGRRMKAEKGKLAVRGETLLEHVLEQVLPRFDEVLVSLSPGQEAGLDKSRIQGGRWAARIRAEGDRPARRGSAGGMPRLRIVEDEKGGQGPMAGILAGLKAASHEVCAVIACDIPDIHIPFLGRLVAAADKAEIVVPVTIGGKHEPLFAVYSRPVVPKIEKLLGAGERSLIPLFDRCRTVRVPLEESGWLRNLNTRKDYEAYLDSLNQRLGAQKSRMGPKKRP